MKKEVLLVTILILIISCTPRPQEEYIPPPQNQIVENQEHESAPQIMDEKQSAQAPRGTSVLHTRLDGCEEKDVTFTHAPLDLNAITVAEPQGELTNSGHAVPGDHVGFQYNPDKTYGVYAMADGYLKRIERNRPFFDIKSKNYHLYFEWSCSMFSSYVHISEIAPELLAADPQFKEMDSYAEDKIPEEKRRLWPAIPVKAGQRIGKVIEWGLLGILLVDTDVTLTGFVNPDLYEGEPWKIHSVPPFDYFEEPLKTQLYAKNPRKQEPRGGKIDFDIDGKLVGNWFKEGTDFSGGKETLPVFCSDNLCPYWTGHLAFVYDFVHPQEVRISFGDYTGLYPQGPYGIKNKLDPATISVKDGLVKFELFAAPGKAESLAGVTELGDLAGVMVVEMIGDRKLKMQVFPGKTAAQVQGFTSAARIYER